MKLILEAIKSLFRELDANKTHWSDGFKETVLLEANGLEVYGGCELPKYIELELGKKYTVTLNDTEYECTAWLHDEFGVTFIGNAAIIGPGKDSKEPFITDGAVLVMPEEGIYNIKIATVAEDIHYLDNKYIKDMYGDTREYQDSVATFDGNSLNGKDTVQFDDYGGYVKISNNIYPYDKLDELIGKSYSYYEEGSEYIETITSNMIEVYSDFAYWVEDVLIVLQDTEVDGYYYSKGVWGYYRLGEYGNLEFYVTSFPVKLHASGKLTQIDPKYLPDSINQGFLYFEEELSWIMERFSELENRVEELSSNYLITATYSPISYFRYGNGELKGLTSEGKAASEISVPPVIDGVSITSINAHTFYGCTNLTSVAIPNSVTSIGGSAFYGCTNLVDAIIGDSVTSIDDWAFNNCNSLTNIVMPNSMSAIGKYAFQDCSSLTNIVIPNGVTAICDSTFSRCTNLTSIAIPDSVTTIDAWAFSNCTSLTSINIPNSVRTINQGAFNRCDNLINVVIPDSVTYIGADAFSGCGNLTSIIIPDSVAIIGSTAFQNCINLTNITIPDGVKTIATYTFSGCTNLNSVVIPSSVTVIGKCAFSGCRNLTSIVIPNSVTIIGRETFYNCCKLSSVVIPNSVTVIDNMAFSHCTNLTSITIPNSVTTIGDSAFSNCSNLTTIYYTGTEEEWDSIAVGIGNDRLINASKVFNYVPAE